MDKTKLYNEIENLECELIKFKNELLVIKGQGDDEMYDDARDYIKQVEKTYNELDELIGYVIEFNRYFKR